MNIPVSILILTYNEELDLPGCLASIPFSDDIHVFDSFSKDKTVQIATASGAHVMQHAFTGYASQRNAALTMCSFKYPWVLILDADERIPIELSQEISAIVWDIKESSPQYSAYRIQRRDYYAGTWLQHVQTLPFYLRLVRSGKVHYEREINEVLKVDGAIGECHSHFDHFPFSKGLNSWIEKHNKYSQMEAQQIMVNRHSNATFSMTKAFFCDDFNERRFHQKELYYRMPFRPLLMFALLYIAKRGFLDGSAGFNYAILRAIYEYMIVLKVKELEAA